LPRGWKIREFGYATEEVDYEKIKSQAKEILSKASKGQLWKCRCGTTHIPIVVNNQIVGEMWRNVDLNSVEIGNYWYSPIGKKVQLVSNGEIVGFIWLE